MVRRRRRIGAAIAVFVVGGAAALALGIGPLGDAVRELTLPLRHEDVIRQQAERRDLDAALIAAVIYEESKFEDRTSSQGARGLMQITPATAEEIERLSGGSTFTFEDLGDPELNIRYGTFYLRYLLDHYDGDVPLAVAAYNAGLTQVDRWVAEAGGRERFDPATIPFVETREYVRDVLEKRGQYREHYAEELGL